MNLNAPYFFERLRIEHTNFRSAVTHIKQAAVSRQAPPFARIGILAQQTKIASVVSESCACFPGELKNLPSEKSNAFTKKLRRQFDFLEDLAGVKTHLAQG
jgi:hypothetical protein